MVNVMMWARARNRNRRNSRWKNQTDKEHELSLGYLRAQIENSLTVGWAHNKIYLFTNFEFQHAGVKAYPLQRVYGGNSFVNKWLAVQQLYNIHRVREDVFFHDTDAFQCIPFEFPKNINGIAFARAHGQWRWGCGVALIRNEYIPGLMRRFTNIVAKRAPIANDEHVWDELSRHPKLERYFQVLPRTFNVAEGRHWEDEYAEAEKPMHVLHIKPHQLFRPWHWRKDANGVQRTMSETLTPPRLRDLFIKHGLWHPKNDTLR